MSGCFLKSSHGIAMVMTQFNATSLLMSEQGPSMEARKEQMLFKGPKVCAFLTSSIVYKHPYLPFYHWETWASKRWGDLLRVTSQMSSWIQDSHLGQSMLLPSTAKRWLGHWFSNLTAPRLLGLTSSVSDSVGLGWSMRICISNKSPSEDVDIGPGTTLWETFG